jgi:predicted nucleic acid-binding protein
MKSMLRESWLYYPDGVVDTCVIVVSLFRNPLHGKAMEFLPEVLKQRKKAAIPLTAVMGAFHITTRYLRLPVREVRRILVGMLETRSRAFYPYIFIDDVINSLEYVTQYDVKPWDGYIIRLAKSIGNGIVYTFDKEFEKVKDLRVINPFPEELVKQYHEHIRKLWQQRKKQANTPSI